MKIKGFTPVFDVLVQKYDTNTALVYGKIWRVCDWSPMGICSMSNDTLGEQLGLSEKTIRRKKEILETDGLIKITGAVGSSDSVSVVHDIIMSMDIVSDPSDNLSQTADSLTNKDIDSSIKDTFGAKPKGDLVDGMLAFQGPKNGIEFPEVFAPYADAWALASHMKCTKAERTDWLATFSQWVDLRIKPEDVQHMYQYARDHDWGIARPGSVTKAFRMMGQESGQTAQQKLAEQRKREERMK